jgi:CheY-like chemotaxis protein
MCTRTPCARAGFAVQTTDTTDEGFTRACTADVIVTEFRVPGSMDRLELVERLRSAEATEHTPMIVLTACAFELDECHKSIVTLAESHAH